MIYFTKHLHVHVLVLNSSLYTLTLPQLEALGQQCEDLFGTSAKKAAD